MRRRRGASAGKESWEQWPFPPSVPRNRSESELSLSLKCDSGTSRCQPHPRVCLTHFSHHDFFHRLDFGFFLLWLSLFALFFYLCYWSFMLPWPVIWHAFIYFILLLLLFFFFFILLTGGSCGVFFYFSLSLHGIFQILTLLAFWCAFVCVS